MRFVKLTDTTSYLQMFIVFIIMILKACLKINMYMQFYACSK